jgi:hypothetical protein
VDLGRARTDLEIGLQRAGDVNNDNAVTTIDFNIVRITFNSTIDLRADFNNDGVINIADFNLLRGNFGLGGAPPLGPDGP